MSTYDKFPTVSVPYPMYAGYDSVNRALLRALAGRKKAVLVLDGYPGVRFDEILAGLMESLPLAAVIDVRLANLPDEDVERMLARNITNDRVFGVLSCHNIEEFFDARRLAALRGRVEAAGEGVTLVYGVGASLVSRGDVLLYADLARWEIQQRYRSGEMGNWCAHNEGEETLRKVKRGYFIDWRVNDRHKHALFDQVDYFLDTNRRDAPVMMAGGDLRAALALTAHRPFRVVPYFDPGVWGGQWMKKVCGLDPEKENYAWSFDGVPEENSLLLESGGVVMELPAQDLVLEQPRALLGERVHARFGAEFPIRFDFLDTVGGQNLSLQVHPLTEYIQQTFGMHYTQDESYYILDVKEGSAPCVYLGVKTGTNPEEMLDALAHAQETGAFDAEKYVNRIPARKHDHFLIPAGTVHCSGRDAMVLEISATPYIFTFKLWDWNRVGLDGKPRPIHLEHGRRNIQFDRDTDYVMRELVGQVEEVARGDGFVEERTGLHEREFIETRRHWFTKAVRHETQGGVNMLNLVEGSAAVVESPSGAFAPFTVHYAETFILPASVGAYTIRPAVPGEKCATMKAYVRG
jgi:mannose-6-phosphate isomerase class I